MNGVIVALSLLVRPSNCCRMLTAEAGGALLWATVTAMSSPARVRRIMPTALAPLRPRRILALEEAREETGAEARATASAPRDRASGTAARGGSGFSLALSGRHRERGRRRRSGGGRRPAAEGPRRPGRRPWSSVPRP